MKKNLSLSILITLILNFVGCKEAATDLNRHPSKIHYSRHARCRMGCRFVDESEVKEILDQGRINFSKSDLQRDACHKRYALEGTSHDKQKLRIIVAECHDELTVITVIDLGNEWPCQCD